MKKLSGNHLLCTSVPTNLHRTGHDTLLYNNTFQLPYFKS
uniref:Uncharacterized protein n=1 Tax=Anguilla anguilla TaxID=7936 RepID=A0A0E9RQR8_ANGAN